MSKTPQAPEDSPTAIALISCPDQKGLVAAVTEYIFASGGNIVALEQHVDPEQKMFFMRIEWDLTDFDIPRDSLHVMFQHALADRFDMRWSLYFSDVVPRMAVFVSKQSHCLYDILARIRSGEWHVEIPIVLSNHPDLEPVVQALGIPFHVFPITADNKNEQEARQLALLKENDVNFLVLARYMQIVTERLIEPFPNRVINIHHSFLPAFPGARPYHSAHERGVKIIGATSHYVTAELDAGPIIEQDVVHVRHTDSVRDLVRKGRDLEKIVLARAIWRHLNRQVLVHRNRTIVFG